MVFGSPEINNRRTHRYYPKQKDPNPTRKNIKNTTVNTAHKEKFTKIGSNRENAVRRRIKPAAASTVLEIIERDNEYASFKIGRWFHYIVGK